MKFVIKQEEILNILKALKSVTPKNTTIPVFNYALVVAEEDRVDFFAAGNEMSAKISTYDLLSQSPVVIQESGKCLLPIKEVMELANRIKGDISICGNDTQIVIKKGKSEYNLPALSPDEFPTKLFVEEKGKNVELTTGQVKELFGQALYAYAKEQIRPVLTGLNVTIKENQLSVVATDSHRLVKNVEEVSILEECSMIIPGDSLKTIMPVLPNDNDEPIEMVVSDRFIRLSWMGERTFSLRLLEGTFPDTSRIIPQAKYVIQMNREELLDSCQRIFMIVKGVDNHAVHFTFNPTNLVIEAKADSATAVEEVEVKESTLEESQKLGINLKYFIDALSNLTVETVEIGYVEQLKPLLIRPLSSTKMLALVLPVKINE